MANLILEEIQQDLSLKKYDWNALPQLKKLRDAFLKAPASVCIERARYLTRYLQQSENTGEPMVLRRANGIAHYLSSRSPLFLDENMLAGSSTSKTLGAPVYPEFLGLSIWPELDTISTRKQNPQLLSKKDADELNFDIFPYWMDRTVLERTRKEQNPPALGYMEKIAFFLSGKSTGISHTTPYYEHVLKRGLADICTEARQKEMEAKGKNEGEKADFYGAMRIALEGIMAYAKNLSAEAARRAGSEPDATRKKEFEIMADICSRVPAGPARTFREAANAVWLCHVGVLAENINMALNPGRLDQILYPYFVADIEQQRLTLKDALLISGCLWLKIADNTNLVPETAEKLFGGAGSVPAVTLGGVDQKGADAVNDLTYIMLRITELLSLRDPNVNARYHYEINDRAYRDRVCQVILNTRAIPAFYNDKANTATLVNQGVSLEHSRDYSVVGCVEITSSGREYASTSAVLLNLTAPFEMTLYAGKRPWITGDKQLGPDSGDPSTFSTFDQFREAFKKQLAWIVDQAIDLNEAFGATHQKWLPTPLLSALFDGPMEKGKDLIFGGARYNSSGATHVAFADICDSLNAIEQAVFMDKRTTMQGLIQAVEKNFAQPHADLLPYLKNNCPKYGTEHPIALKNSQWLIKTLYDLYQSHTNYRGGTYRPAYWTMTNHAGLGRISGALPSGKKAREVFSSGITPASQCAPSLPSAFIAIASLNSQYIPGGVACNIKYTPQSAAGGQRESIERFGDLVEAYFQHGGMQVQFNVQDYETLIDAKKHPEKYPELIVRVSGYSAFFKDLNDAMKDELITRTQYTLADGKAVPLPAHYQGGVA